jgi:hypothetical protein
LAEETFLNFFVGGEEVCFHCMLCCLLLGSKWCTQVSFPITIHSSKPSPSLSYQCKNRVQISTRFCLWSSVSCLGIHLEHTLWCFNSSCIME